jgi:hypothetical protein
VTPTKDLGVWTSDECALVLIDFQKEMFETIHSETSADLVELAGKALEVIDWYFEEVPMISSTIGVDHRAKVTA